MLESIVSSAHISELKMLVVASGKKALGWYADLGLSCGEK
jgi:hypothetical protein